MMSGRCLAETAWYYGPPWTGSTPGAAGRAPGRPSEPDLGSGPLGVRV